MIEVSPVPGAPETPAIPRVPGASARRLPPVVGAAAGAVRVLVAPLLACLLVLLAPVAAQAHNVLTGSDPKDGAVVEALPPMVTLTFDQSVRRDFARIAVTGPDGAHYEQGQVTVAGGAVSVDVRPGGPQGAYTIGYRIVSNDGHPVTGMVRFTYRTTGYTVETQAWVVHRVSTGAPAGPSGAWVWGLLAATAVLLALCALVLVRHDRRPGSAA